MTTTDRSRRRVRWAAMGGTVLAGAGVAVGIAADPFPVSQRPKDPAVAALEMREKALTAEATRVNAVNAERWATYRTQLSARQQEIAQVNSANAASVSQSYSSASQAGYVQSAPVASSSSS